MAKDNRKIVHGVTLPEGTFTEGQEDELEAVLTPEQVERLKLKGTIEGDWKGKGKERAPMPGSRNERAIREGRPPEAPKPARPAAPPPTTGVTVQPQPARPAAPAAPATTPTPPAPKK